MDQQVYGKSYEGDAAENYQRYFVPSIGAPMANDLMAVANLQPGERVLDVACGTGVVTQLAARQVGTTGSVAGLDINPGMLAVAASATPSDLSIGWHEANAESMPFPDRSFDVVLCQMALQFMPGKLAALRQMRRVLDAGGRVVLNMPGPKPPIFAVMSDALARHVGSEAAAFADLVFSMHDADEVRELMRGAGFREVEVTARPKRLRLPAPADFLWQYVYSTPMAAAVARVDEPARAALQHDACNGWREYVVDGKLSLEVRMTTATAVK